MHPDLPYEQAYFDRALALRDRQQADLARAPSLAANPTAAVELRKRVSRLGLADPDEAIAFGRIEAHDDRWYIGKGAIWDDDNDLVVVNWQAPIAAPFYTATPEDPEGLDARRLFRCSGNQIREIEDLMFREVADAIAAGRTARPRAVRRAARRRSAQRAAGELGDIVATIQAAQYEVISRPLDQLLVVQGGPGTGKTVVGPPPGVVAAVQPARPARRPRRAGGRAEPGVRAGTSRRCCPRWARRRSCSSRCRRSARGCASGGSTRPSCAGSRATAGCCG